MQPQMMAPGGQGVGGGFDIKSMMMSMFMIDTVKNGGNNPGGKQNIWASIYPMLAMMIIDKLSSIIPILATTLQTYVKKKFEQVPIVSSIASVGNAVKTKTASITIEIALNSPQNIVGHAILDYVTNLQHSRFVTFLNNTYILSNKEPILIDEQYEIWVFLKNQSLDSETSGTESNTKQIIEIYSFQYEMDDLRKYINRIANDYQLKIQNKLGDYTYYFDAISSPLFKDNTGKKDYSRAPNNLTFTMKPFSTNRRFKNVMGEQSKLIRKRVEFFKNNKKWYDDKGIPYTLGLLLSGAPGGGKTSTIKCIANETGRHIINIQLTDDVTKSQLENLFFSNLINVVVGGKSEQFNIPTDKRIYVFEDIDCQGSTVIYDRALNKPVEKPVEKQNSDTIIPLTQEVNIPIKTQPNKPTDNPTLNVNDSGEKLTLSCLLNILDGILETPGRIIIMTSNYPGKLDKALIRPGRVDLICEFTRCTNNTIIEFLENFYETKVKPEDIKKINEMTEYVWTPAELTKILFENFGDYDAGLSALIAQNKIIVEDIKKKDFEREKEKQYRIENSFKIDTFDSETVVDNTSDYSETPSNETVTYSKNDTPPVPYEFMLNHFKKINVNEMDNEYKKMFSVSMSDNKYSFF